MLNLHAINPAFLAASAVALVPIILHLVQRRRRRRVVFGSVRFLRKMSQRVVRRRRLTELILIVLRAAALVLLAVGFARLFFYALSRRAGAGGAVAEEAVLVLVDHSYSMTAGDRLARAKTEATRIVQAAGPLTKVAVGEFTADLAEPVDFEAPADRLIRRIKGIGPTWRPTRLGPVLQRAGELMAERAEAIRRIVLISDFQETSWDQRTDGRLPAGVRLEAKPVAGAAEEANVFIDRLTVPPLVVAGGFGGRISARIANRTGRPVTDVDVTLKIDGKTVERRSITVKPHGEALVRFGLTFRAPGDVTGTISLGVADAMPADNAACFAVQVTPKVRILLVNGEPHRQLVRNDGFFYQTALAPKTGDRPSPFEVRQVAPDRLKPEDIQGVEGVVLTNVDTIPPAAAKALGDFLYAGGGVGFLVGARTDPDRFNRTFRAAPEPIAPCRLWKTGLADGDEPVIVTWTDLRHDVFALFAGPRHGDLAVAEFRQYYQVRDSQAARVLARFSNGHPALLEMRCAREGADGTAGRSLLFASSADLEWNDLCLKGVFVPFVHQFARRLCARRSGGWARNVQVGDEVVVSLGEQAGPVQLTTPDGKTRTLRVPDDGRLRYTPVRPGLHRLSYEGGSASFAANLAPGEADLTEMDTRVLLTAVQPEPAGARPLPGGAAVVSAATAAERVEQSQRIWVYLIAAGLAVLAAEMVLSARAGTA